MSTTYHIVCEECKTSLWIGQRGSGNTLPHIYTDQEYITALNLFLTNHISHQLRYLPDYELDEDIKRST